MWLSLQILFAYFLTLPSLLHSSIFSIVFLFLFYCFECNSSLNVILHGLLIQLQCTSVARFQSSRVRWKSVATPLCLGRLTKKLSDLVAMILVLSWLTAEWPPEGWPLLEPLYSWSNQRSIRASLATSALALALSRASYVAPCTGLAGLVPITSHVPMTTVTWLCGNHHGNTCWACVLYDKMANQTHPLVECAVHAHD